MEISEAVNGLEGIKKIRENTPDLIFLDLLMPELDGFEVLERLKKSDLKIPVIVLTADIQETSKKRCFDLGAKNLILEMTFFLRGVLQLSCSR